MPRARLGAASDEVLCGQEVTGQKTKGHSLTRLNICQTVTFFPAKSAYPIFAATELFPASCTSREGRLIPSTSVAAKLQEGMALSAGVIDACRVAEILWPSLRSLSDREAAWLGSPHGKGGSLERADSA